MFLAALSTIAKLWKELDVHQQTNDKEDVVHIYNGILLSYQKERILNICCNMDKTGGDNAKLNKSSRERQLSYGFTHLWNIRNTGRSVEKEEKNEGRVNRRGNEPRETTDSGKQTEGFRGEEGGEMG